MSLLYENELKMTLSKFGTILDKIDVLEMQKDEIRDGIRKFIEMNNIDEVDIRDTHNQLWRLGISLRSRKSVNCDLLKEYLTKKEYTNTITIKESEFLTSKRVKQRKKAKPKAPSALMPTCSSIDRAKDFLKGKDV